MERWFLITISCRSENAHRYKLVISSSMCCGITYLVFGVIRLSSSFPSLKPRTLITEHKILSSGIKIYIIIKTKKEQYLGGGGESTRACARWWTDWFEGLQLTQVHCLLRTREKRAQTTVILVPKAGPLIISHISSSPNACYMPTFHNPVDLTITDEEHKP
jgi:hypothetical protein